MLNNLVSLSEKVVEDVSVADIKNMAKQEADAVRKELGAGLFRQDLESLKKSVAISFMTMKLKDGSVQFSDLPADEVLEAYKTKMVEFATAYAESYVEELMTDIKQRVNLFQSCVEYQPDWFETVQTTGSAVADAPFIYQYREDGVLKTETWTGRGRPTRELAAIFNDKMFVTKKAKPLEVVEQAGILSGESSEIGPWKIMTIEHYRETQHS